MNQQINLYQPMFRRQQVVFSARTTLALAIGFLGLLALWWWLLDQRVDSLESGLQRQQALEQQLSERIARLNADLAEQQPDPVLVDQVDRLGQRLDTLQSSRELVRRRIPDRPVAVSERLAALGRQHPSGLWLTGIEISDSGRELAFRGRMLAPPLLPQFLERLGNEPVFSGQSFRQLQLRQSGDSTPGLRFTISTAYPEADE